MSLADANRKYFDAISGSYDTKPWFAKVNQQVTDEVHSRLDWLGIPFVDPGNNDGKQIKLLDYACGTGLMTRIFAPYVTTTTGMDVSPNMISTYTTRLSSTHPNPKSIEGITVDLLSKSSPSPPEISSDAYFNYDIAAVSFAFHHFEDPVFAATQLRQRLRPGGVLLVNDFLEGGDLRADEDGNPVPGSEGNHAHHGHGHHHGHGYHGHGHGHGHAHNEEKKNDNDDDATNDVFKAHEKEMNASIVVPNFTIDGVREIFEKAGFVDVDVVTMQDRSYMEFGGRKMWRTILFARGKRPEDGDGDEQNTLRSEL